MIDLYAVVVGKFLHRGEDGVYRWIESPYIPPGVPKSASFYGYEFVVDERLPPGKVYLGSKEDLERFVLGLERVTRAAGLLRSGKTVDEEAKRG